MSIQPNTLALAEEFDAMLHVRLSPCGRKVNFSLADQGAKIIAGPCPSERELEALCGRLLKVARAKSERESENTAKRALKILADSIVVTL